MGPGGILPFGNGPKGNHSELRQHRNQKAGKKRAIRAGAKFSGSVSFQVGLNHHCLKEEMSDLKISNARYWSRKEHTTLDKSASALRQSRLLEIKRELADLMKRCAYN